MTEKVSRQQRRLNMRDAAKKQVNQVAAAPPAEFVPKERFDLLVKDVQKILNYAKTIDSHSYMLMETFSRLGVVKWEDIATTKKMYQERDQRKKDKIKDLLSRDMNAVESLDEIIEEEDLPSYEILNIHPIKDLNLNPYEVASILKEQNKDLSKEEYLALGKKWDLTLENFGFKKEKKAQLEEAKVGGENPPA